MSMKSPLLPLALCAALLSAALPASADGHGGIFGGLVGVRGSGVIKTQQRQVGSFDVIQSKGSVDVDVRIAPQTTVTVEADDNLLDLIRTEVSGRALVIDTTGNFWSSSHSPVVHITVPALTAYGVAGSGDARIEGLSGDKFGVKVEGSGDVKASGKVAHLHLVIQGSGDADLKDLAVDDAAVRIDGSGDATVSPAKTLEVTIHGSGDVSYYGDAVQVTSQVHGSGDVIHK
jgi:hypothetical protein